MRGCIPFSPAMEAGDLSYQLQETLMIPKVPKLQR